MKKTIFRLLTLALCLTMLAVTFSGTTRTSAINLADAGTRVEMSAADIYEQNVNSTVGITTSITTNVWGYQTTSAASGSGFIITSDGYILTNYHVIEDSSTVTVTLFDGTVYDAAVVGYDESNDIAVLKVEAQNLTPVTVGDSTALRVGDDVIAIGNPLGELTFYLTGGRISALNREITVSSGVTMNLIQTDCAINSGNSGGALFNMYGEVIGITNAKYSSGSTSASIDNIGFAIPISQVIRSVVSIVEYGYIAKPYIGVSVTDVSEEAISFGLPRGAAVRSVVEDSPAEAAGLAENDIITAMDGIAVGGRSDLSVRIGTRDVDSEHTLPVYRQGETLEVPIRIGQQVQDALPTPSPEPEVDIQQQPPQGQPGQGWNFDPFEMFGSFEDFFGSFGQGQAS